MVWETGEYKGEAVLRGGGVAILKTERGCVIWNSAKACLVRWIASDDPVDVSVMNVVVVI